MSQFWPTEKLKEMFKRVRFGLEDIFTQFDHGSGNECKEFVDNRMRSLSVGDFVQFEGQWWECLPSGWDMVKPNYVILQCCIRGKKGLRSFR